MITILKNGSLERNLMKYLKLVAIALMGAFWVGLASAESLGIYTHRQPILLEPI